MKLSSTLIAAAIIVSVLLSVPSLTAARKSASSAIPFHIRHAGSVSSRYLAASILSSMMCAGSGISRCIQFTRRWAVACMKSPRSMTLSNREHPRSFMSAAAPLRCSVKAFIESCFRPPTASKRPRTRMDSKVLFLRASVLDPSVAFTNCKAFKYPLCACLDNETDLLQLESRARPTALMLVCNILSSPQL